MIHSVLATQDLTIGYTASGRPSKVIASGISVELFSGELVCLLGPNGAGKSTLLRTLARLQPHLAGQIKLSGIDLCQLRPQELARRVGVVLTDRINVGNLSVHALVALGRYPYTPWTGKLTGQDEEVVRWAIQTTGIEKLAQRNVNELSDGERQRAMIARALTQESDLLLLDEPTAFLDLPGRVQIMGLLRNLARETHRALLLSTHDLDLALRSADRIWLLPQGGPLRTGIPEELVLDGSLESTFQDNGVEFDKNTGSFKIHKSYLGQIHLLGEGLSAFWTARALEREGFEVVREGRDLPFQVEVLIQSGRARWRSKIHEIQQEHFSLLDLISVVKSHLRLQVS